MGQDGITQEISELRIEYCGYALEQLGEIETKLLDIEKNVNVLGSFRTIKLLIHSIKGSAGSYDLNFASIVCHQLEDFLASLKEESISSANLTNIFSYIDLIKAYLKNIDSMDEESLNELKQKLESLSIVGHSHDKLTFHKTLVIEHSKTMITAYSKILSDLGIRVSVVSDGYEALGRLLREDFDSIVTSQKVNTIDGIDLISIINVLKNINKNMKTVLISSDQIKGNKITCKPSIILQKNAELTKNLKKFFQDLFTSSEVSIKKDLNKFEKNKIPPLKKILCVDDDRFLHGLVAVSLKSLPNISMEFAFGPKEALEKIETFTPDVILSDVIMDDMSGPDLLKKLKEFDQPFPLIFVTGKSKQKEIDDLMKLGCIGVITKPFNIKTLSQNIMDIWGQYYQKKPRGKRA